MMGRKLRDFQHLVPMHFDHLCLWFEPDPHREDNGTQWDALDEQGRYIGYAIQAGMRAGTVRGRLGFRLYAEATANTFTVPPPDHADYLRALFRSFMVVLAELWSWDNHGETIHGIFQRAPGFRMIWDCSRYPRIAAYDGAPTPNIFRRELSRALECSRVHLNDEAKHADLRRFVLDRWDGDDIRFVAPRNRAAADDPSPDESTLDFLGFGSTPVKGRRGIDSVTNPSTIRLKKPWLHGSR